MQSRYYDASLELATKAQKDMEYTVRKTAEAQKVYLRTNSSIYTEDEIATIHYFLDAFFYKYQLANYSLEQLWAMRDAKIEGSMADIIRNAIVTLGLTKEEEFLQSHFLEQFLFQSRACLDFYMLYLTKILRTSRVDSMSVKKFYNALHTSKPDLLGKKAEDIKAYFSDQVFSDESSVQFASTPNWGKLLRSLRDKIAHRDRIIIVHNSRDQIMNDVLVEMPTLQNMTYEQFGQTIENGMYEMIRELFPVIYGLEWQPGPYKDGMFDT